MRAKDVESFMDLKADSWLINDKEINAHQGFAIIDPYWLIEKVRLIGLGGYCTDSRLAQHCCN
jgi:hypothetical protein